MTPEPATHSATIRLPHGDLRPPVFLPDGTRGVVRGLDAADLEACGIQAVQMNVLHLMQEPGSTVIEALGGLHRMSGWPGPITTDSGGFQVYSLIRQDAKLGSITKDGAIFKPRGSTRKYNLTPEKSIRLQFDYGSDLLFCLDDCTHVDNPYEEQQKSVERTIAWARRCRVEYDRLIEQKELPADRRPLLLAAIQGGGHCDLRQHCAEALLEIGFDGFGYGGWPLDSDGHLLVEMVGYVRELVPRHLPVHGLGIGHPQNIVECVSLGYEMFDSTMPTRDARHGRLYRFEVDPRTARLAGEWFSFVRIKDGGLVRNDGPVSAYCDCLTCRRYSLGYLHHLHQIGDGLYERLATIHNLRFMTQLMDNLRGS